MEHSKWWNGVIHTEVKKNNERHVQTRNQQDGMEYKEKRKTVKRMIREANKENRKEFGKQMNDNFKINERAFWNKIRNLRGRKK